MLPLPVLFMMVLKRPPSFVYLISEGSVLTRLFELRIKGVYMSTTNESFQGKCACGKAQIKISGKPIMRVICHCEICQEFNEAPYADILIYANKHVDISDESLVEFKAYTTPEVVQRGKCGHCHKPAIEYITMPMAPSLTIVPTANINEIEGLPDPSFHTFYHRRKADVSDSTPKYSGFIKSQIMFMVKLIAAKIKA